MCCEYGLKAMGASFKLTWGQGSLGSSFHRDERGDYCHCRIWGLGGLLGLCARFLISGGTCAETGAGHCSSLLVLRKK